MMLPRDNKMDLEGFVKLARRVSNAQHIDIATLKRIDGDYDEHLHLRALVQYV